MSGPVRYDAAALIAAASRLFEAGGLAPDRAAAVAEVLVEGDLLGQTTHGLNLLAPYLDSLAAGVMAREGEPEILSETPVALTWDGRKLPGPWLVRRAMAEAVQRAAGFGIGAVSIRRAHHIGCLSAYLRPVAEAGRMAIVTCSDPSTASVAPWGGTRRVITPNPLAAGWPSPGGPVMIDVSMSLTTNGMTARRRDEGRDFDHDWLLDAEGAPTRDPSVFFADPAGTLMPLGGPSAGHKGYALGLLVEALTSALCGFGRAEPSQGWGASVLVLVLDPARFGGLPGFTREAAWMEEAVHANPPAAGGPAPRLPGERALRLRAEQLARGVALHPAIPPVLAARCAAAGIPVPSPIAP